MENVCINERTQGKRRGTTPASSCLKFGCMNVRGWGVGKLEDVCKELNEWKFDIVGLTETHLRDRVQMEENGFVMMRNSLKDPADAVKKWTYL